MNRLLAPLLAEDRLRMEEDSCRRSALEKRMGYVFVILFGILIVLGVGVVTLTLTINSPRRRFEKKFGFRPSHEKGAKPVRSEQRRVDSFLTTRAYHFRAACSMEDDARTSLAALQPEETGWLTKHAKARRALEFAKTGIKTHRDEFWRCWGIARKMGFAVHRSYHDYIPRATGE